MKVLVIKAVCAYFCGDQHTRLRKRLQPGQLFLARIVQPVQVLHSLVNCRCIGRHYGLLPVEMKTDETNACNEGDGAQPFSVFRMGAVAKVKGPIRTEQGQE